MNQNTPQGTPTPLARRDFLGASGLAAFVGMGTAFSAANFDPTSALSASDSTKLPIPPSPPPFRFCLNTSTIRGQNLGIVGEVEVASKAGYGAIEPWLRDIDAYVQKGGTLADLAKRIVDAGLTVESAIGFAQWIVDDPTARKAGLEQARRDMDTIRALGGTRIAAPPAGATQQKISNLDAAAERYHTLCELGTQLGVVPQVEVWGFSKTLSKLGETVYVALESGHPSACLLLDIYHLMKGGSGFSGLKSIAGQAMHVFHMNDYPATPVREMISDADRVFCGDGIAPLATVLKTLQENGFHGWLSLELFNRGYWKRPALEVAREGLTKMKAAVALSEK